MWFCGYFRYTRMCVLMISYHVSELCKCKIDVRSYWVCKNEMADHFYKRPSKSNYYWPIGLTHSIYLHTTLTPHHPHTTSPSHHTLTPHHPHHITLTPHHPHTTSPSHHITLTPHPHTTPPSHHTTLTPHHPHTTQPSHHITLTPHHPHTTPPSHHITLTPHHPTPHHPHYTPSHSALPSHYSYLCSFRHGQFGCCL